MSLINQMLKDLEVRQSRTPPMTYAGQPSTPRGSRYQRLLLPLLATLLILVSALAVWLWWQGQGAVTTAQTPAPLTQPPLLAQAHPEAAADTAPPSLQDPTTAAAAPPAEPLAQAPITIPEAAPTAISLQTASPAARTHESIPEPQPTPSPEPAPRATAQGPVSAETSSDIPAESPLTNPQIERRVRPPSPAQLADRHYQQGYRWLQQGETGRGREEWQQALQLYPPHIPSREGLAVLWLNQGDRAQAAALLREGLVHHPGHGQFANLLARIQLEQQQTEAAIHTLDQALAVRPQNAEFHALLAALQQRSQNHSRSIEHYRHALSMRPQEASWWMGMGISLEGAGRQQEARQAYIQALEQGGLAAELRAYVQQRLRLLP